MQQVCHEGGTYISLMLSMASLLEEIKEEIKQEEWQKFWLSYGFYALVVSAGLLVAVGGYLFWSHLDTKRVERRSMLYEEALAHLERGQYRKAEPLLKKLVKKTAGRGYGELAQLSLTKVARDRALTLRDPEWTRFWHMSVQGLAEKMEQIGHVSLQSLLTISLAYGSLDFAEQPSVPQLSHYETPENPWKGLSLEVQALQALKSKELTKAGALYERLFTTLSMSPSLRMRAEVALIALGFALPRVS
jgi:hypothetical protein